MLRLIDLILFDNQAEHFNADNAKLTLVACMSLFKMKTMQRLICVPKAVQKHSEKQNELGLNS